MTRSGLWLGHGHCLFTRLPLLVAGLAGCGRGVRIVRVCVCVGSVVGARGVRVVTGSGVGL